MIMRRIFKVQLPIASNLDYSMSLAYPEDRSVQIHFNAGDPRFKVLGGELKSFWYAEIKNGDFILEAKAPWQNW